jgi:hypothetical protein
MHRLCRVKSPSGPSALAVLFSSNYNTEAETKEVRMPAVSPLPKEKASPDVHDIYDKLTQANGFMPAFFGTMAHRPAVLKVFLSLYGAVINQGTVEPRYKELAYLKTARINGCEY